MSYLNRLAKKSWKDKGGYQTQKSAKMSVLPGQKNMLEASNDSFGVRKKHVTSYKPLRTVWLALASVDTPLVSPQDL